MYKAKIIKDSIAPNDCRLTTMEITFPRISLCELNTHRMVSKNGASSRAIPFKKMLERIMTDPFIPTYWGKNQGGMSASEELSGWQRDMAIDFWLKARDEAVEMARALSALNVHKQIVNRLLEPFMWQTMLVSATDWDNFFALRAHKDAQPEFQTLAYLMLEAMNNSMPDLVKFGEWHFPYGDKMPEDSDLDTQLKIGTARAARLSYLTQDGEMDLIKDLTIYERLVISNPKHMSPTEHIATPLETKGYCGNFKGWMPYRKTISGENVINDERLIKHTYNGIRAKQSGEI